MAPKAVVLEQALVDAAGEIFNSDRREELSVNAVRKRVEEKFELDSGFFTSANWKTKSKDIIKGAVNDLFANDAGSSAAEPKSEPVAANNGLKRQSSEEAAPAKKRQKRESSSPVSTKAKKKAAVKKDESSSELSELSESEDARPTKKRKAIKRGASAKKKRKAAADSDDEESGDFNDEVSDEDLSIVEDSESEAEARPTKKKKAPVRKKAPAKRAAPRRTKEKAPDSEEDEKSAKEDDSRSETKPDKEDAYSGGESQPEKEPAADSSPVQKPKVGKDEHISTKQSVKTQEDDEDSPLSDVKDSFSDEEATKDAEEKKPAAVNYNSDSSLSIVYDEAPTKAKRGRKPKAKGASEPKATKGATKGSGGRRKSAGAADATSPDEVEIKKLQSQLVKCGVRKIWAFELKQYGGDAKAKIKHLKGMLRDIGMDGRFSEARAREIKEMRELAADLEAVQEMDKAWGVGGRASRSRAAAANTRKSLKELSDDEDDEDEDGGGGDGVENKKKMKGSDGDDSGSEVKPFAKSRRPEKRHADLAFLGDESESD